MAESVKKGDKVRLLHSEYDENLTPDTPLIEGLEGEVVEIQSYELSAPVDNYTDYEIKFRQRNAETDTTWIFYRHEFEVISDGNDA